MADVRLINKVALFDTVAKKAREAADTAESDFVSGLISALGLIKNAPTIEAEPVRKGTAVEHDAGEIMPGGTFGKLTMYTCSECGKTIDNRENYCPNCGARMIQNKTTPGRTFPDFIVPAEENANRCVSCGEIIPEGRQVCPKCENTRE